VADTTAPLFGAGLFSEMYIIASRGDDEKAGGRGAGLRPRRTTIRSTKVETRK
jgi:hypothetical protein